MLAWRADAPVVAELVEAQLALDDEERVAHDDARYCWKTRRTGVTSIRPRAVVEHEDRARAALAQLVEHRPATVTGLPPPKPRPPSPLAAAARSRVARCAPATNLRAVAARTSIGWPVRTGRASRARRAGARARSIRRSRRVRRRVRVGRVRRGRRTGRPGRPRSRACVLVAELHRRGRRCISVARLLPSPSRRPDWISASSTRRLSCCRSRRRQRSSRSRTAPRALALADDRLDRALAHALHRAEAVADGLVVRRP